jgi:ketosteroid isomerase-like protein
MKTMLGVAVMCSALLAGAARGQQAAVQRMMDDLLPAANAHDTDRFLSGYVHDSTLVFAYNGSVTTGYANVRDLQLKAWAKTDVVYSQRGPMTFMTLTPNVVVVTDPLSGRRTGPDGQPKTSDFIVTMVCQKRPEGWRIVYVHESSKPS